MIHREEPAGSIGGKIQEIKYGGDFELFFTYITRMFCLTSNNTSLSYFSGTNLQVCFLFFFLCQDEGV